MLESMTGDEGDQRAPTPLQHEDADHARLDALFHTLDHNGDGFIDEHELIQYMTSYYGEEEGQLEEEARVSEFWYCPGKSGFLMVWGVGVLPGVCASCAFGG